MKINTPNRKKELHLKDVEPGTTFVTTTSSDVLYMKTGFSSVANAVRLNDGQLVLFGPETLVTPVEAELTVY